MRLVLLAGLGALLVPAPSIAKPDSVEAQLIARERQSWDAWQSKDLAFWQRHLSADHVEMDGPDGPQGRDYVLKGIAGRACAVTKYELDRFSFRRLGPGAGMLVYRAEQEFACGDKRIPNIGWVTSVYRMRSGRWENVLFEHVAVPPPKATATTRP
jgi:hypothetical protein